MNTPLSPAAAAIRRMTQEIRQLKQTNAELLEALEAIVAFDTPLPCGLLKQARAAIAKAKS